MAEKYLSTHTGAEIDAAVDKINEEPVLLWSNPAPTSAFAAQTININGLLNYQYLILMYKDDLGGDKLIQCRKFIPTVGAGLSLCYIAQDTSVQYFASRYIIIKTSGSVEFRNNYFQKAVDNNYNVPYAIYGTNNL